MKYDHAVKVNGVIYMTGEEVPVMDNKAEEKTEKTAEKKRTGRKPKGE